MMIDWPEAFRPGTAPIHVRNVRESLAPPNAVWAWLIRASKWPEWYPNSKRVVIEHGGSDLSPDASFKWSTFGVSLVSRVEEFVPGERIAWTARGMGVWAYHAWLIQRKGTGSVILTEETQYGWVAKLGATLMPNRMRKGHDLWLEALDRMAVNGPP